MPSRTKVLKLLPWQGGLNTTDDESMIRMDQLTRADDIIFSERGSRKKREGIKYNWDSGTSTATTNYSGNISSYTIANPTVVTTSSAHNLVSGDRIYITGSNGTSIDGMRVATVLTSTTFSVPVNVTVAGTAAGTFTLPTLLKLHDFWYGTTSKTQALIGVNSGGDIYSYSSSGTRTLLTDAGTAWATLPLTSVSTVTFNNRILIAVQESSGTSSVIKMYNGSGNVENLTGTPPKASILATHIGRVWTNDKTNKDRLHYSPTNDHTQWNGADDSGAFDIGQGDGDPEGITGLASFKGDLFVFKKTKIYRVIGQYPEEMEVKLVSSSLGCVANNSIVQVEQDDLFFVSERGIHSLNATFQYGDFTNGFVSRDIQKTFNEVFTRSVLNQTQSCYLDTINCIAFTFRENTSPKTRTNTTTSISNCIYLFNLQYKAWFRWYDIPASSVASLYNSSDDEKKIFIGSHTNRVLKTFNGTNYDINYSATNTAISMDVITGRMFPENEPFQTKGFKKLYLFYKPTGTHNIIVKVYIDNTPLSNENTLSFTNNDSSALLGSSFIVGESILGLESSLNAYGNSIEGIGSGLKISLEQSGVDTSVEIQGIAIEYEDSGLKQEVANN